MQMAVEACGRFQSEESFELPCRERDIDDWVNSLIPLIVSHPFRDPGQSPCGAALPFVDTIA